MEDTVQQPQREFLYYTKEQLENSPTRRDGWDEEKEESVRSAYCSFITDVGMNLGLPYYGITSAFMLCHMFYARRSMARTDVFTLATAALVLAAKIEDVPRRLIDTLKSAWAIRHTSDPVTAAALDKDKALMDKFRETVVTAERALLYTLGFGLDVLDLQSQQAFPCLLRFIKALNKSEDTHFIQTAWNIVGDSSRTTLCLREPPEYIAAAAVQLTAVFLNVNLRTIAPQVSLYELAGFKTPEKLGEICNEICDVYEKVVKTAKASKQQPPTPANAE